MLAGAMVSAATGVMGSVIGKLTAMLGEDYQLAKGVKRGIRFLRDELSSMHAVLQRLADMDDDQIDLQTKEWRSKVRELSYDIEDCIDRFMLNHSHEGAKANFVRKTVRKMKILWEDRRISEEIQELKALVVEEKERRDRYNIDQRLMASPQPMLLDPRASSLFQEARDLVGIEGPREEIIRLLKGDGEDEKQLKVVSIFGAAGQGKTTLAMEVYRKIEGPFDCRASVSVSRTPDIKKLLKDMLFQISRSEFQESKSWDPEQLIRTIRENLLGRRYLILIDDIWSTAAWEHVLSALPVNDSGSIIITTTRIKAVAQSCRIGVGGHMYEARPLGEDDSRRLFFKRVFGSGEDCPQHLKAVGSDVLKKCSGLPLAIISMAGLLANKSQTVEAWLKMLESLSSAVEKDSPIEKMQRILSLSYFDLPHHLKSCLLYLSLFPEDYSIDCRELIWAWVAEGLILGQNRESMEQQGESYLNELINRSMIQPIDIGVGGTPVKLCRVHDVVLDFIVSQAVEDNFVTIWDDNDFSGNFYTNKIRRLSIQAVTTRSEEFAKAMNNMCHLRSVYIFGHETVGEFLNGYALGYETNRMHIGEFLNSPVLRVLNMPDPMYFVEGHVGHIQRLTQLKYLSIGSAIEKLPEEIGKLQQLETLHLKYTFLKKLPASIVQLQKLVRLFVPYGTQLPDGIGNLRSLEELSFIDLDRQSAECIQGLGGLTKLRVLEIDCDNSDQARDVEGRKKVCISSLAKLLSLRSLRISNCDPDITLAIMTAWSSPTPPLRRLVIYGSLLNSMLCQICTLVNLTRLRIEVGGEVSKEGIKHLSSLPMLLSLTVVILNDSDVLHQRLAIGGHGFQRLVKFNFRCWIDGVLEFEPAAMPKLQRLKVSLLARCQFKYGDAGLLLGLHNQAALKHVTVDINCYNATADEVEALEDDIRGVAGTHPDRPVLVVTRIPARRTMGHDV